MTRKILLTASALVGLAALGFAALVVASLRYDRSNPRDRPNAYLYESNVVVDAPVEEAYHFFQYRIPDVYPQVAGMHSRFEILNADALVPGAVVECEEGDDDRIVRHRYVVARVIPNRLLHLESSPSLVYDRESGEEIARTDAEIYYDFEPLDDGRTRLTQTIVIDLLDPFHKALADIAGFLSGTRDQWADQFTGELRRYAGLIERDAAAGSPSPAPDSASHADDPRVY